VATTRKRPLVWGFALVLLSVSGFVRAEEAPAAPKRSVADIKATHDRSLVRDLAAYVAANPTAEDVDQAYLALFDKVIEHDWFAEHETRAGRYLTDRPDGPVRSLAQIVATMARAQAGDFPGALTRYDELMKGLGKPEQEEFASNFADSLAASATGAGAYPAARHVYQTLLGRYSDSPNLRQKVKDELNKLDKVGKPAPSVVATDVKGASFRLEALRGKYVLVDFWATWCAPCIGELPRVQAAYEKYRGKGFEIVAVSLDESKAAVTDFVTARKIPWRQLHNASAGTDLVEAFGVSTIPATFLIDPNGVVIRLELRGPALDKALAELLGGATADPAASRTSR
jgi:thiol-disulfide isomerase/thioredoxin